MSDQDLAMQWVHARCGELGVVWSQLDGRAQREITREIPCRIRCWRVGVPVDTQPGNPCEECGSPVPIPSLWERLLDDDR